ncbi:hypothetical protein [Riemerella anatipestifer]|uniref:hypothetical protein n=1 Tax=Riemerella anatipestifer TaxID=34085 RepID=UPI00129DDD04|nr:hypothetical protein [Riemerella anatipestifer]MRM83151.1 hypothetical protein [Riemerella anatipestifer]
MKIIILSLVFIIFSSCYNDHGYIYDADSKKPINDVVVQDIINPKKQVLTDSLGRFSFIECNDLIISKEGYKTDTLQKYGCKPNGKCFNGKIFYMKK